MQILILARLVFMWIYFCRSQNFKNFMWIYFCSCQICMFFGKKEKIISKLPKLEYQYQSISKMYMYLFLSCSAYWFYFRYIILEITWHILVFNNKYGRYPYYAKLSDMESESLIVCFYKIIVVELKILCWSWIMFYA